MSLDLGENTLFLVTLNLSSVMLLGSSSLSMCLYSTLHLFIRYYSSLALLHSVSATADFSLSLVVSEISSHCCQSACSLIWLLGFPLCYRSAGLLVICCYRNKLKFRLENEPTQKHWKLGACSKVYPDVKIPDSSAEINMFTILDNNDLGLYVSP